MGHRSTKKPKANKKAVKKAVKKPSKKLDAQAARPTIDPKTILDRIAPPQPTPETAWQSAQRSPVYRLPILCNGEASAERDADGMPVDGTGAKCKHYWAFRRIPEAQNAHDIKLGETTRYCRNWVSAEGPMEFGEGRELMANVCDCYEPDAKPRPWVAALEQKPPDGSVPIEVEAPAPAPFDPGVPSDEDFVWPTLFGRAPADFTLEKDSDNLRWIVHRGDSANPTLFVYFRLAFTQLDEFAQDQRFPVGDVRRYDRDRLLALEQCLELKPLNHKDIEKLTDAIPETAYAFQWVPVLNRPRARPTIADALA